jgi:hypothetical protein
MTSPEARKGSTFERDVVKYLQVHGHPYAERAYGAGRPEDTGDIDGLPGWTVECKNHRAMNLAGWCDQAQVESVHGRRGFWAVICKRRGKPTSQSYVVLDLECFVRLLSEVNE